MSAIRHFTTALAFGATLSTSALASDMRLPPEAPPLAPQERLEFGTGWYLRGDLSWARERTPIIFPDGSLGQSAKLQNGWSMTIGGGYKFNNWFRADMTYDYFKEVNVGATSANFTCYSSINPVNDAMGNVIAVHAQPDACFSRQTGRLNRHAVLANVYLDLGTWSGVTPYVGAGAGAAYGRVTGHYDWYTAANGLHYGATLNLPNPSPIPLIWLDQNGNVIAQPVTNFGEQDNRRTLNRRNFNMAYAFMAGFAYDVSPNAKIDMGYRFINLGKFGAGAKSTTINEYRIGFRYMID